MRKGTLASWGLRLFKHTCVARPPGMRTVSGPATFFRGDWSWNNFYGHSLPTADWSRTVVRYWGLVLVNRLGRLPRNSVVRLIVRLDMTIVVDWGVKQQTNKIKEAKSSALCLKFPLGPHMSRHMRKWYLWHRRPAKAKASLRIRAVSPEPLLFAK